MAGDEDRLARARPFDSPAQVTGSARRLAVLVDTQQAEVEAPAREIEVVGIAAECRDRLLRSEHQPHVVVAVVFVEEVLPALIQRDGFAGERAFGVLAGARGFQPAQRLLAHLVRLGVRQSRGCGVDLCRDVFATNEHRDDVARALTLGGAPRGVEAFLDVVVAGTGQLADATHGAVMIRQHQAVRRYERAGAAAFQARDRALHAPEPGVVDVDAVLLLYSRSRKIVERPHAFVRDGGAGDADQQQQPKSLHGPGPVGMRLFE